MRGDRHPILIDSGRSSAVPLLSQLSKQELSHIISVLQKEIATRDPSQGIPIEIFCGQLAPAEALVKYLKEEKKLGFSKIKDVLARDERGLWSTYKRACTKHSERFSIASSQHLVPYAVFTNRSLSHLENLTLYLVSQHWNFKDIAKVLGKSYSTIYTVYRRAKQKRGEVK